MELSTHFNLKRRNTLFPARLNHALKFRSYVLFLFCFSLGLAVTAQTKPISGTVVDSDSLPLPAVNVTIKGTSTGTSTDFDGKYSIEAAEGDQLNFTSMGFTDQTQTVGSGDEINVMMQEDVGQLDEVVVQGYGKQERNRLTTSISKMDNQSLKTATHSNAASALQGEIPGLQITNTTGQPGSSPNLKLRGGTGFDGSGDPLVLIDGHPGDFYGLDPNDIESIEVMKDAASTSIYGARAADGVILITTKEGKEGKTSINVKQKFSFNYKRTSGHYLEAEDFITENRKAVQDYRDVTGEQNAFGNFLDGPTAFGVGNNTTDSPYTTQYLTDDNKYLLDNPGWHTVADPLNPDKDILYQNTDMGDEIYQTSHSEETHVSFQGGNEDGTYYSSFGYLDEDGMVLGSGFTRFSGKLSGSYNIFDNVKVNADVRYEHSKQKTSSLGPDDQVFRRYAGQPPTSRIYNLDEEGNKTDELNPGTNKGFGNPLYYDDKVNNDALAQRFSANMGIEWDITSDFTLNATGSHTAYNNLHEYFDKAYLNGGVFDDTRKASADDEKQTETQLNATLNYTKSFDEHHVDALIGTEYYRRRHYNLSAATKNSPTDIIPTLNAGSEEDGVPSSDWTKHVISSLFGRINYDFKKRYLLEFNFRYDGSSRLNENKFGFFPGISGGWNAHEEDFYQNSPISNVLTKLKPRISYGVNGKVGVLGDFQTFGEYGSQGIYDGQKGYANTSLPTPDLKWEKSKTLNFGLDFSLFENDRISFMADYFIRDVDNKIANITLPHYTGFSGITSNNGTLRNRGFELEVDANIIQNEDLQWSVNANITEQKNFVKKLPENDNPRNRQGGEEIYNPETGENEFVGGLQEGQRVGNDLVITYIQEGIYKDQDAVEADEGLKDELLWNPEKRYPGDVKWKNRDDNDKIDKFDRAVIGRTTPDIYGGLSTNLNYKGFGLYIKTDFALGHMAYSHIRGKGIAQTQGNQNSKTIIKDSWTPDNRNTDIPRYSFTDPQGNVFRGDEGTVNSRFWEKADYLALREVTLSYDLPTEWFHDYVDEFQLFVTGSNLYYFTGYSGTNPEQGGYQNGEFPVPRTLTLGVNLTF